MTAPNEPQPQAGQQVMMQPWGMNIVHVGEGDQGQGKIVSMVLTRQLGERLVFLADVKAMRTMLQSGLDQLRQIETGIVVAAANTPLPPINGHR